MRIRPFRTLFHRIKARQAVASVARERAAFAAGRHTFFDGSSPEKCQGEQELPDVWLSVTIHPFAGLGHQLASWISGYLWARDLGAIFVGPPLTSDSEGLLELKSERAPNSAFKFRMPAVLDERDPASASELRAAILRQAASPGHKLFTLPLDPPRWDQTPAAPAVRTAILAGRFGRRVLELEAGPPYIAIHVRRGDVNSEMYSQDGEVPRWVSEQWYVATLAALRQFEPLAQLPVKVFSVGDSEDLTVLLAQPNVEMGEGGSRDGDLISMIAAKVLVTSPSSFSFSAALASRGMILVKHPWWHEVPNEGRWVRVGDGGVPQGRMADAWNVIQSL